MREMAFALTIVVMQIFSDASLHAQVKKMELRFFDHDSETLMPHPTKQTPDKRLATLKIHMESAIEMLERGDTREFVENCVDPYVIAEQATNQRYDADFLKESQKLLYWLGDSEEDKEILRRLRLQLKAETQWMFEGRVAWFGFENDDAIWVFREGRWYYSPVFVFSGGATETDKAKLIGFFADHDSLKKIDFKKLDSTDARLKSLRVTQREMLKATEKKSHQDIIRYFVSPIMLAKHAITSGELTPITVQVYARRDKERTERLLEKTAEELAAQLAAEPLWLLDGRVAVYPNATSTGIRNSALWQFYEGRWRWYME